MGGLVMSMVVNCRCQVPTLLFCRLVECLNLSGYDSSARILEEKWQTAAFSGRTMGSFSRFSPTFSMPG
jgi:hypothetical protein